jgi:hypothetical protein
MTDADLRQKVHGLVDPVLGIAAATGLIDACAELAEAPDVRRLIAASTPA